MLSRDDNELLCRVGAGSAGNRLFRSLWLPALPSAQLGIAPLAPVRLRLLGEDLIAFRDASGRPAIVGAACAHRGAPLFHAKIEPSGVRCPYHGWVYDGAGRCVEIPSDPSGETCARMRIPSYRVAEQAGVVWIYMGEAGSEPALPRFPWVDAPDDRRLASVWLQETNWFQGAEGEIDSSHVSVLHRTERSVNSTRIHRPYTYADPTPQISVRPTPIGFRSIARRRADAGDWYWRVTQWMAPMFSFIPSAAWPVSGRAWVPIDDHNTYCWDFSWAAEPFDAPFLESVESGVAFPPQGRYGPIRLDGGATIDTWRPKRTRENDYLVDRALQRRFEATGIYGVNDQDRALQEGMGRIVDRTREKLVAADLVIVQARRFVLELLRSPEALARFREVIADGSAYAMQPLDAISPIGEVDAFMERASA